MAETGFRDQLDAWRRAIESALTALFDDAPLAAPEDRVWQAMRYATMAGGKRLRPVLTLAAVDLLGGNPASALNAACAVELLHSYSLVHDDLPAMDNSDLRRGNPTTHIAFDDATAVLAGDGLLTLAFERLADPAAHADPAIRAALCLELAQASGAAGMVGGQMLDILMEGKACDQATLIRLQAMKTGRLISYSLRAGAIWQNADSAQLQALTAYGDALGLAFQITDDLLDVRGDSAQTGKPVGGDENLDKSTFVSLLGIEGAEAAAADQITAAKQALRFAGNRAGFLRALADYVLTRSN